MGVSEYVCHLFGSRAPHFIHTKIGSNYHRYPPQPSHSRVLQGGSNLVDGSWRLSNMYLEMAREEDTIMAEGWHADAEGILLFVSPTLSSVLSM